MNVGFVTSIFAFLTITAGANAGLIVVSGDTNIGNALAGDSGSTFNAGNQTFFTNLLGARSNIVISRGTAGFSSLQSVNDIGTFYTGSGKAVTYVTDPLGALSGVDLFISAMPGADYSGAQISAISTFLASGGTLLFTGENAQSFAAIDGFINDDLLALGSGLHLDNASLDTGFQQATGSRIVPGALTLGITSFEYALTDTVSGGTAVFNALNGAPFIAYESTGAQSPEPSTALLLLGVMTGLAAARKRLLRRG